MSKKKNPQDATRRNTQAANKKLAALSLRVRALEQTVRALARRLPKASPRPGHPGISA